MAVNDGIGNPVRDPFPGITAPAGTGAPGSDGITAPATAGSEVGRPYVMGVYDSAQDPSELTRVPVLSGDTSAMSDDMPVHQSPIMAGPVAGYLATGAGAGSTDHHPHPSGNGRWARS